MKPVYGLQTGNGGFWFTLKTQPSLLVGVLNLYL